MLTAAPITKESPTLRNERPVIKTTCKLLRHYVVKLIISHCYKKGCKIYFVVSEIESFSNELLDKSIKKYKMITEV